MSIRFQEDLDRRRECVLQGIRDNTVTDEEIASYLHECTRVSLLTDTHPSIFSRLFWLPGNALRSFCSFAMRVGPLLSKTFLPLFFTFLLASLLVGMPINAALLGFADKPLDGRTFSLGTAAWIFFWVGVVQNGLRTHPPEEGVSVMQWLTDWAEEAFPEGVDCDL